MMATTTTSCTGEPISWLQLERFALGELEPAGAARVQEHLQACPLCARCLAEIRGSESALLPALPAGRRANGPVVASHRRWRWLVLAGASALAAASWLLLPLPGRRAATHSKGVDMVLTLVRERQGTIQEDPPGFLPEDRFKALVTCPPGRAVAWALVLLQDGAPAVPVASGGALTCGNRVPLPGAFRLTGNAGTAVCFLGLIGQRQPPLIESHDPAALEQAGAACLRLSRDPG
jgi:hypothetical protein